MTVLFYMNERMKWHATIRVITLSYEVMNVLHSLVGIFTV